MLTVYIPKFYKIDDMEKCFDFIEKYNFGIIISYYNKKPFITYLPFLLDRNNKILFAHLAKANDHSKYLDNSDVVVLFNGPHGYISPNFYINKNTVPTWNYTTVHIYGKASIINDPEFVNSQINELISVHESKYNISDPYTVDILDKEKLTNYLKRITCIKIKINSFEGKFKINQERPREERENVIQNLKNINNYELADFMSHSLNDT